MLDEMSGKINEFKTNLGELTLTVHGADSSESLWARIEELNA